MPAQPPEPASFLGYGGFLCLSWVTRYNTWHLVKFAFQTKDNFLANASFSIYFLFAKFGSPMPVSSETQLPRDESGGFASV